MRTESLVTLSPFSMRLRMTVYAAVFASSEKVDSALTEVKTKGFSVISSKLSVP